MTKKINKMNTTSMSGVSEIARRLRTGALDDRGTMIPASQRELEVVMQCPRNGILHGNDKGFDAAFEIGQRNRRQNGDDQTACRGQQGCGNAASEQSRIDAPGCGLQLTKSVDHANHRAKRPSRGATDANSSSVRSQVSSSPVHFWHAGRSPLRAWLRTSLFPDPQWFQARGRSDF